MNSPLKQHIIQQLNNCAGAFIKANLANEWHTLEKNIQSQLHQLALSSDYAIKTLCQFPQVF